MSSQPQNVPLQPLGDWGAGSVLGAHFGATAYLLGAGLNQELGIENPILYTANESVWRDLAGQNLIPGITVVLQNFQIMDWFPRAPGLYYSPYAQWAREEAFLHLDERFPKSPIRDHAHGSGGRLANDYTVVFTPEGKLSMLQGGIGAIRLKPVKLQNEAHWLLTATSDGVTHTGVPIALPQRLYSRVFRQIRKQGSITATITGQFEEIPDPFTRLFDWSIQVPKWVLRVTDLQIVEPRKVDLETSVAVSFVSEYTGRPGVYSTYVTFRPDVEGSFEDAVRWMKAEYVEGGYQGRIITDFDQTVTIFPEARLALNKVMARSVSPRELAEAIELMQVSARADEYFDEITRRELLPRKSGVDRTKLFVSYARQVESRTGWVSRIRTQLQGLGRSMDFEVWDDSRIQPGTNWDQEIAKAIKSSRAAVLILTADFLASEYIRNSELPLLLEAAEVDGMRIFCVCGSDVYLSGPVQSLARYQFVNNPREPLNAMTEAQRESIFTKLCRHVDDAFSGRT
jgi:TIR domain